MKVGKYAKFIVAALAAAAVAANSAISDGMVTASEWVTIAVAAVGALGVFQVPNRTDETPK